MSTLQLLQLRFLAMSGALILTACGNPPAQEKKTTVPPPPPQVTKVETATDVNKPPRTFLLCRSCHAYEVGKSNAVGPNLVNVFGNPAGADKGYKFSKALLESEIVWDYETLDAFLVSPTKTIPGTKMAFVGLKKEDDRAELIEWMESLNAEK